MIYKLRSKTIALSWMFMLFIAYVEDNSTSCESKLYTILYIQNIHIHVWTQKESWRLTLMLWFMILTPKTFDACICKDAYHYFTSHGQSCVHFLVVTK